MDVFDSQSATQTGTGEDKQGQGDDRAGAPQRDSTPKRPQIDPARLPSRTPAAEKSEPATARRGGRN